MPAWLIVLEGEKKNAMLIESIFCAGIVAKNEQLNVVTVLLH